MLLFGLLLLNANYLQVVRADEPAQRREQPTADPRGVLPRARPDPGRRQGGRVQRRDRRPAEVPAEVRPGAALRAGHRLLLHRLRRQRHRGRGELHPRGHRRQPVRPPGHRPADRVSRSRAAASSSRSTPRRRRRRTTGCAAARAQSSPSSRRRAPSWRWSPARRTTRTCSPRTTPRRSGPPSERLNADPDKPMLDRALRETYPPGSTFKLVTASAALESGKFRRDTKVYNGPRLDLPQTDSDLPNFDGQPCSASGRATLEDALKRSCNAAFGKVGLDLGADRVARAGREVRLQQPRSRCR